MAWTTKSILPHFSPSTSNTASMVAGSVTSQWPSRMPSSSLASGSTRFFNASPCQVSAISAPAARQALAMPQAIERLLATPRITPRLPCIRPEFADMPVSNRLIWWGYTSALGRYSPNPPDSALCNAALTAGIVAPWRCYVGGAFAGRGYQGDAHQTSRDCTFKTEFPGSGSHDCVSPERRGHDSGAAPLCPGAGA